MSCAADETPYPEIQRAVQHDLFMMAWNKLAMNYAAQWIVEQYSQLPANEKHLAFAHPNFDQNMPIGGDAYVKKYPSEISIEYAACQLQCFISTALAPRFKFYADLSRGKPLSLENAMMRYICENCSINNRQHIVSTTHRDHRVACQPVCE